jgi:hypothetical protein
MAIIKTPPLGEPIVGESKNVTIIWNEFFLELKRAMESIGDMPVTMGGDGDASSQLGVNSKRELFTYMGIMGTL